MHTTRISIEIDGKVVLERVVGTEQELAGDLENTLNSLTDDTLSAKIHLLKVDVIEI